MTATVGDTKKVDGDPGKTIQSTGTQQSQQTTNALKEKSPVIYTARPVVNTANLNGQSKVKYVYLGNKSQNEQDTKQVLGPVNKKVVLFRSNTSTNGSVNATSVSGAKVQLLTNQVLSTDGANKGTSVIVKPPMNPSVIYSTMPKTPVYKSQATKIAASEYPATSSIKSLGSASNCAQKEVLKTNVDQSETKRATDSLSALLAESSNIIHGLPAETATRVPSETGYVAMQNMSANSRGDPKNTRQNLTFVGSTNTTPFTVTLGSNQNTRTQEENVVQRIPTSNYIRQSTVNSTPVTSANIVGYSLLNKNSPLFDVATPTESGQHGSVRYVESNQSANQTSPSSTTSVSKSTHVPGTDLTYRTPGASNVNKSGNIKRPMNAFMVWARKYRSKLANTMPNATNSEISIRLGQVWNEMTNDDKQPYYDEAERIKHKHRSDFPGWVYCPNKNKKKEEGPHSMLWARYNNNAITTYHSTSIPTSSLVQVANGVPTRFVPISSSSLTPRTVMGGIQSNMNLTSMVNAATLKKLAAKKFPPQPIRPKIEMIQSKFDATGRPTIQTNNTVTISAEPAGEETHSACNPKILTADDRQYVRTDENDLVDLDKILELVKCMWPFPFPLTESPEKDYRPMSPPFHTVPDLYSDFFNKDHSIEELLTELDGLDPYDCFYFENEFDDCEKEMPVNLESWQSYLKSNVSPSISLERCFMESPLSEDDNIKISPVPVSRTLDREALSRKIEADQRKRESRAAENDEDVDLTVGAYEEIGCEDDSSGSDTDSVNSEDKIDAIRSPTKISFPKETISDSCHFLNNSEDSLEFIQRINGTRSVINAESNTTRDERIQSTNANSESSITRDVRIQSAKINTESSRSRDVRTQSASTKISKSMHSPRQHGKHPDGKSKDKGRVSLLQAYLTEDLEDIGEGENITRKSLRSSKKVSPVNSAPCSPNKKKREFFGQPKTDRIKMAPL